MNRQKQGHRCAPLSLRLFRESFHKRLSLDYDTKSYKVVNFERRTAYNEQNCEREELSRFKGDESRGFVFCSRYGILSDPEKYRVFEKKNSTVILASFYPADILSARTKKFFVSLPFRRREIRNINWIYKSWMDCFVSLE